MKKYFSRGVLATFIIATVFVLGAFMPSAKVSADASSTCDLINLLVMINVIPAQNATQVLATFNCSAVTATTTATTTNNMATSTATSTPISVLSPNGGERWVQGSAHNITWQDLNTYATTTNYGVYLNNICRHGIDCGTITIATNISTTSYAWNIASSTVPVGEYKVRVCNYNNRDNCDLSNSSFRVIAASTTTPISGVCSNIKDTCTVGNFVDIADSTTTFLWTCAGANGGATSTCSKLKPTVTPVSGVCSNIKDTCTVGNFVDIADSTTTFLWTCAGANGGATSTCSKLKSVATTTNGTCASIVNTCTTGTFVDIADEGYAHLWKCKGVDSGTNDNCSKTCGSLSSGESLAVGKSINSCDGKYKFTLEPSGSAVLYSGSDVLWSTKPNGKTAKNITLETNGNFVIRDTNGGTIWMTTKAGTPNAFRVQKDGNLVIYDVSGRVIWASGTMVR
jgi:hypothetical protein